MKLKDSDRTANKSDLTPRTHFTFRYLPIGVYCFVTLAIIHDIQLELFTHINFIYPWFDHYIFNSFFRLHRWRASDRDSVVEIFSQHSDLHPVQPVHSPALPGANCLEGQTAPSFGLVRHHHSHLYRLRPQVTTLYSSNAQFFMPLNSSV